MSAFIVSDNHINAIVSWASANGYGRRMMTAELQATGSMLMAENCKSVGNRYADEHTKASCADALKMYRYKLDTRNRSAVEIIKACDCLAYQSSESQDWQTSDAKRFLDEVKQRAISKLAGYTDAAWAID